VSLKVGNCSILISSPPCGVVFVSPLLPCTGLVGAGTTLWRGAGACAGVPAVFAAGGVTDGLRTALFVGPLPAAALAFASELFPLKRSFALESIGSCDLAPGYHQ